METGIRLIEDGAQSFGTKFNLKSVYEEADLSTLSFYPAKVFGGIMDGGAILCRNQKDADEARILCNHGRKTHYSYSHSGWNSRISEIQARYLIALLTIIDEAIQTRQKALDLYQSLLEGQNKIKMIREPQNSITNGYLMVAQLQNASNTDIVQKLKDKNVGSAITYPETIDAQAPAKNAIRFGDLKTSRSFITQVINLPLYGFIDENEVREAVKRLKEVL